MPKQTIQEFTIAELRGSFPDVPAADGVDMEALRAADADPMFVTLPFVPAIGATSKNGLLYDAPLVDSIVAQINAKRPGGIFGHLRDEERASAYPEDAVHWIGAAVADGKAWAKGYIPPGPARERIRRLKATGGQIATSIYGRGDFEPGPNGARRLRGFELETLDFAPPGRAALGNGAQPIITAELDQGDPDMSKEQIIAELTAGEIPAHVRAAIIAEFSEQSKTEETIAELRREVEDRDALLEDTQGVVAELRREQFSAGIDAKVAELTKWAVQGDDAQKKLETFRRTLKSRIIAEIGEERKAEKVQETIDAVWADLEPLAETLRDSLAGPAAVVGGRGRESGRGRPKLEDTPEARAAALRHFRFA